MLNLEMFINPIKNASVINEPYPHMVVDDYIDKEVFNDLFQNWPHNNLFPSSKNEADRIGNRELKNLNDDIYSKWRFVLEVFSSRNMFCLLTDKFKLNRNGSFGKRFIDNTKFVTDAQFVINRPKNFKKHYVVEPHIDNPIEIYAGLWYFENPKEGAILVLVKNKDYKKYGKDRFELPNNAEETFVECKPNRLILFKNYAESIHYVTEYKENMNRKYINFIAERNRKGK